MITPSAKVKAQGCNTNPTLQETCSSSVLLSSPQTAGWTYTWYSCDASGNNPSLLNSTPSGTYTVYPSSSTGNQTYYYIYIGDDGNSNLCASGVITVKYDFDVIIADVSGTYTVQLYTSLSYTYQWYADYGGGPAQIPGQTGTTYAPTQSGIYTVIRSSSTCSSGTSNPLTYSAINAQCNTSTANYSSCGSSFGLAFTPTPGYSIDWYECDQYGGNGSLLNSGNTITVSPSSTTSQDFYYYYVCKDNFINVNCTSAVITVEYDLNLNIHLNNGTTLPPMLPAMLTANSSGQNYSSYQWYRNGQPIIGAATNFYYATIPGEYYMTCTSSCGASTSNAITFCSIGNAYSNEHITADLTLSSTTVVLDGTITIDPDVTLTLSGCDVYMTAGSEIIVKASSGNHNGGNLILSYSTVMGCGKWGGIYAEGGTGNVAVHNNTSAKVTLSHSEIHDAYVALFADNNAILAIDYTLFENNFRHIDLRKFDGWVSGCSIVNNFGGHGNAFDFSNNTFNYLMEIPPSFNPTNLPTSSLNNSNYRKQVYIDYGRTIKLSNCTFNCYNWNTQDQNAVEVYNVDGILCGVKGFEIDGCTFNGDYNDAIMFTDVNDLDITNTNISGDVNHGIELFGGNHVNVSANTFYSSSNTFGGKSWANVSQVNDFQFHNNDVQHFVKGIEYYYLGNGSNSGSIDSNTFKCNQYGIVVAPECDPTDANCTANHNYYFHTRYLDLLSNRIFYCDWGIVGVGNLKTQGSTTREWETSFDISSNSNSTTSTYADVAWYKPGLKIVIYDLSNYALQWVSSGLNLDGHTITSNSHIKEKPGGAITGSTCRASSITSCTSSPSMTDPITTVRPAVMQQPTTINIYPNPSNEYIVLENNFETPVRFSIVDMTGKQVLAGGVKGKSTSSVDISNLSEGCYLIRIYDYANGENLHSQKLIKTGQ